MVALHETLGLFVMKLLMSVNQILFGSSTSSVEKVFFQN